MREKISVIFFLVVIVFIAVFCWEIFNKLFIQTSAQFSTSAVAAFFGAFLAFLFVRIGDFFKSYSDRINKGHNSLIKIESRLNSLLSELDDNVYIIETFEELYKNNANQQEQSRVFIWANRLTPVRTFDEFLPDLLNIDLINELFTHSTHLRKLNESMETINAAYKESKDALISKTITPENYRNNLVKIYRDLLGIKDFLGVSIDETVKALSAVRVLGKNRPLMVSLLRMFPSYHYDRHFEDKRAIELKTIRSEMEEVRKNSQARIDAINSKSS